VDEIIREKIVTAIENGVRAAGAIDYEGGMKQAEKLIEFAYSGVRSIRTIEELRSALDSCPPMSKSEEKIVLLSMQLLPQVLRIGLKMAAKKATSTLPSSPAGRPRATTATETQELLIYISELHRKGCSLKVAKIRASMKYGHSPRTIERLWSNRGAIREDEPNIQDALRFIGSGELH